MTGERNGLNDGSYIREQELVHLPGKDEEETNEENHSKGDQVIENQTFIAEVRHNEVTRFNVVLSISVAFAFSLLGWTRAQAGSAFLDILDISGADLENGSTFMTSYYSGRVLGSILGGVVYSRVNKYLILAVTLTISSLALALTPWCVIYELMITVHLFQGISNGLIAVVLTAVAVSIWGPTTRGRVYVQIFPASFAAFALISPLVTSPFLLPRTMAVLPRNSSDDTTFGNLHSISTFGGVFPTTEPTPHSNITYEETPTSNLYIAYSISAGLGFLSTIPFVIIYIKSTGSDTTKAKEKNSIVEESHFIGNLPLITKLLQLINVGTLAAVFISMDFNFSGYLSAFCVQHLGWTKASGALLTSVFFLSTLCGRLFGICLAKFYTPLKMLVVSIMAYTFGFLGLTLTGSFLINVGVWISVSVLGVPLGITWSSMLSWINENLVPVRGKTSAYILIAAFSGTLFSPLLFGYMMEEVSPIWFCYISLGKAFITVINMIFMIVYTGFLRKSCKKDINLA